MYRNRKRSAIWTGLLLLLAAGILVFAVGSVVRLLSDSISVENVWDAYYCALLKRHGQGKPSKFRWEAGHPDIHLIIVPDEQRRTVKWIYREGTHWYRYVYDVRQKTLRYDTNDTGVAMPHNVLFDWFLPWWLEENPEGTFDADHLGVWYGEGGIS